MAVLTARPFQVRFPAHFITLIMNCVEHAWYYDPCEWGPGWLLPPPREALGRETLVPEPFLSWLQISYHAAWSASTPFPDLYYRCRGRFRLTHLAYADDVLIFANTCGNRISLLTDFLTTYARITGQKVNCQKSQLVFSRQCPETVQRQLQSVTGFGAAELPLTYLGAPLYVGNRRNILYEELLGKLRRYLHAGIARFYLTGVDYSYQEHFVLAPPISAAGTLPPPGGTSLCGATFCSFFWGSYHGHRRRHWISWADIARPQEEGGLGIRRLADTVRAFSFKLWWRLRDGSSLWARALQQKYFRNSFPGLAPCRSYDSPVWKRLCQVRDEAQTQITWNLGRGDCFFWYDIWCGDRPLCADRQDRPPPIRVKEMWVNGTWDMCRASELTSLKPLFSRSRRFLLIPDCGSADLEGLDHRYFLYNLSMEMSRTAGARSWLFAACGRRFFTPTMSVFLWRS
ncbi:uncharacterized protein LOC127245071 [Andrographis paniculata]|uniref:uncharacterized protein LOC127245071 n=1 Tax=Andrographis paniculata TaxID=175694 RepID=UPI0021E993F3|nr:uncharacterized protein LOC127245071 [Andrographis paniculata]